MNKKLKEKILEALTSVVPITLIVFALAVYAVPIPIGTTIMFLAGAAMLIVGMGFFSIGADISMMPMGEGVGAQFGRAASPIVLIVGAFLLGSIITVAEPDLQVLSEQVPAIPDLVLISTVAIGVGLFLALAAVRMVLHISLSAMLIALYSLVFIVTIFVPKNFVAVAFDSGGVTTGPMTVPFLMALGLGLAQARRSSTEEDSFGMIALCSVGPILAVLVLGIVYDPTDAVYVPTPPADVETTRDVSAQFIRAAPRYIKEVMMAVAPIAVFLALFQAATRRWDLRRLMTISLGIGYTVVGLVLFLTGANVGFIPVGQLLGSMIAGSVQKWALVPIGAIIGYYTVVAEPAVHVLNRQVEEVSGGAVSQRAMKLALSLGVAVSVMLSMVRILTGFSVLWLLVPGCAAALVMTRLTPKIFTGIAFDSGGVASGPMTSAFILPFAMGACERMGGNILTDAFGVVAMVAMTPLVAIQVLGLIFARRSRRFISTGSYGDGVLIPDEIIDLEELG